MAGQNENEMLTWTKDVYEAYSKGNWDVVRSHCAESATLSAMPFGKVYNGPSGIVNYLQAHKNAFDLSVSIKRLVACADLTIVEYNAVGAHKAAYQSPDGELFAPTGRKMELSVCHLVQWKDKKIVSIHAYFDFATLLSQMGANVMQEHRRH
jgi:predicted ester cyclase